MQKHITCNLYMYHDTESCKNCQEKAYWKKCCKGKGELFREKSIKKQDLFLDAQENCVRKRGLVIQFIV